MVLLTVIFNNLWENNLITSFFCFQKKRVKSTEHVKKNLCLSLTFDFQIVKNLISVEFSSYYQMIANYNYLPIAYKSFD